MSQDINNAKDEFLIHLRSYGITDKVRCADIYTQDYDDRRLQSAVLTTGWETDDYQQFLQDLNFTYDAGFGGQQLFGTIWYTNGNWSSRGEYDGSEWWEYHYCPVIPDHVNRLDKVRHQKINTLL